MNGVRGYCKCIYKIMLIKIWIGKNYQSIQNNPDKNWYWYIISQNPNLTLDIIQNNPDKDWSWKNISQKSRGRVSHKIQI